MKTEAKSSIDVFEGLEGTLRSLHLLSRKLGERRDATPRVYVIEKPVNQKLVKEYFRALAKKLCREHTAIISDSEILSGTPHIKGTRLSVGTILAKLYVYGDVQAVVKIYEPHLSEEQVKEAIAYAQDFLEIACDKQETP